MISKEDTIFLPWSALVLNPINTSRIACPLIHLCFKSNACWSFQWGTPRSISLSLYVNKILRRSLIPNWIWRKKYFDFFEAHSLKDMFQHSGQYPEIFMALRSSESITLSLKCLMSRHYYTSSQSPFQVWISRFAWWPQFPVLQWASLAVRHDREFTASWSCSTTKVIFMTSLMPWFVMSENHFSRILSTFREALKACSASINRPSISSIVP